MWNNYWLRTATITVVFTNFIVTATAAVIAYKRADTNVFPIIYLLWAAYFLVMLTLLITHKRENIQKAILNCLFLVLLGLPIAGLSLPLSLLIRGFNPVAIQGNFFILVSLIFLFYLYMRHERFTILETVGRLANYTGEITTLKFKSSFGKYLIFEVSLFTLVVLITHICLS